MSRYIGIDVTLPGTREGEDSHHIPGEQGDADVIGDTKQNAIDCRGRAAELLTGLDRGE